MEKEENRFIVYIILVILGLLLIFWLVSLFTEKDVPNDPFRTLNRPQETHYIIPSETP